MKKTAQSKPDCVDTSSGKFFCPYCGCGCRLKAEFSNGKVTNLLQDETDPVGNGKACVKGLTSHEPLTTQRLLKPQIRPIKSRGLIDSTWDRALGMIERKVKELYEYDDRGIADLVFFVPDGQSTNEFNYLFSKLARSHFKTNNVDGCARLCHQATANAFSDIWGIPAIPKYTMDDLKKADLFILVGTDPAENYPVMFNRILEGKKNDGKILSIDVTSNTTTTNSDEQLKLNSNMLIPFLSWQITRLTKSDKISKDAKQFHGFQDLVESARKVSQKHPPSSFGFTEEKMEEIYETIRDSKKTAICFGMGVTQHSNGTENVKTLIQLGILLNAIVFPNRGKMNVQGAGDVGGHPLWNPTEEADRYSWDASYKNHKGKMLTEALYDKEVKFVWIVGGDPAISMPDLNLLESNFQNKFIVYQGHHEARTMEWASVVLPMAMVSEEDGTFTNGERRVRGMFDNPLVKNLPGDVKSGVEIIQEFASLVGAKGFEHKNEKEVFEEMIKVVPGYDKLTVDGVISDEGQLADKEIKYTRLEKVNFNYEHFSGDGKYPFIFTTSRNKFQFCSGNESRNSKSLNQLSGGPVIYMNPADMAFLGLQDDQMIKVSSEVGEIAARVEKNIDVLKRMIVGQFHFPKMLVNKLTPLVLDPYSGTPAYKQVPVKIEVLL